MPIHPEFEQQFGTQAERAAIVAAIVAEEPTAKVEWIGRRVAGGGLTAVVWVEDTHRRYLWPGWVAVARDATWYTPEPGRPARPPEARPSKAQRPSAAAGEKLRQLELF